jgi:hypothetical protein
MRAIENWVVDRSRAPQAMWRCGEGAVKHRRDDDRITLHHACVKLIHLNITSRPSRKCRKVAPRTVIVNARSRAERTVGAPATRLDDDEHGAILTGVMAGSMSGASNVSCGGARSRPHLMHANVAASRPNHGVSDPSERARAPDAPHRRGRSRHGLCGVATTNPISGGILRRPFSPQQSMHRFAAQLLSACWSFDRRSKIADVVARVNRYG